jgi:hypothetical protein
MSMGCPGPQQVRPIGACGNACGLACSVAAASRDVAALRWQCQHAPVEQLPDEWALTQVGNSGMLKIGNESQGFHFWLL